MRFYFDAAIPAQAIAHVKLPNSAERWVEGETADEDLVSRAVEAGAGVLVVVGRAMLEQLHLAASAAEAGLSLVAMDIDDPIDVIDRIGGALHEVARHAAPGRIFVVTRTQVHQVQGPPRGE